MTIGSRTRTGTCYVIGADSLTRQQLYVAMSRATDETHIFVETAETDAHNILTPKATHPNTAIDVLQRVLARDGAQVSATTEAASAADPFTRLGKAAAMYTHSVGALAENTLGPDKMAAIDAAADQVYTGLTRMPAWPTLRMHLATIAVCGDDPIVRLQAAVASRELDTAHDPAAVLDWRLDSSGAHSAGSGPLRWLPDLPTGLLNDPDQAAYLHARHNLVTELAASIRETATDWDATTAPAWARPLLSANPKLRAEIAVFRAAHDVDDADTRLTGPDQYAVRDRRIKPCCSTPSPPPSAAPHRSPHNSTRSSTLSTRACAATPTGRSSPPTWPMSPAPISTSPNCSTTPPTTARCPTKCQAPPCGGVSPAVSSPRSWKRTPPPAARVAVRPGHRVWHRDGRNHHR